MNNESKTLFIPLWGKAMMSKEGLFSDKWAEEIVDTCGYDFASVDKSRKLAIMMAMRASLFDRLAAEFVREHPGGIVLQLGVGLDSRVKRVNSGLFWVDLDFPEVVELRKQFFPESENYHYIAAPALPADWIDSLPDAPHALVIAEGLSMYLSEKDMRALMMAFQCKWPNTFFVFDAYSRLAAKLSPLRNPINAVKARIDFALDDPETLIRGMEGVSCELNTGIITEKGLARLTGRDRLRFSFMRRPGNRLYRVFGYRVNKM